MNGIERLRVLNATGRCAYDRTALDAASVLARSLRASYIVAMNPEKTFAIKRDERLCDFVENADLIIPDGAGMVLGARILHGRKLKRVPGADLMQPFAPNRGSRDVFSFTVPKKKSIRTRLRNYVSGIPTFGSSVGKTAIWNRKMDDLIRESRLQRRYPVSGLESKQEAWMSNTVRTGSAFVWESAELSIPSPEPSNVPSFSEAEFGMVLPPDETAKPFLASAPCFVFGSHVLMAKITGQGS